MIEIEVHRKTIWSHVHCVVTAYGAAYNYIIYMEMWKHHLMHFIVVCISLKMEVLMGRMLLSSVLVAVVFQCTQGQISSAVACNCVREHVQVYTRWRVGGDWPESTVCGRKTVWHTVSTQRMLSGLHIWFLHSAHSLPSNMHDTSHVQARTHTHTHTHTHTCTLQL